MEKHKEVISRILVYLEQNLEQKLDLEQISAQAGYSKFYLNRIFSEETGYSIYQYLRLRRLELAAEKLKNTALPIAQIALEAGYDSQQAFTLAFKQSYSCTPGQYRGEKKAVQSLENTFRSLGRQEMAWLRKEGCAA